MRARSRLTVYLLILASLSCAFFTGNALSKTRYVEKWGDPTNQPDCKRTAPCLGILQTIANSNANDRVVIGPGVYGESITIPTGLEGLKLESVGGRYATTIVGDGSGSGHVVDIDASRVQIGRKGKGFTILGATSGGNAINAVYPFNPGKRLKIQGNRIGLARRGSDGAGADYDNDGGIYVAGENVGTQITNNIVQNTQGTGVSCLFCIQALIKDNRISGNGTGIVLGGTDKTRVLRNVITQNLGNGIEGLSVATGLVIKDNVSAGNTEDGIDISDAAGTKIQSNIVARNEINGLDLINITVGAPNLKATNNLVVGNINDAIRLESINPTIDGNTLVLNGDDGIDFHNTTTTRSLKKNNIFRNFGCGIRGIDNFVIYDPVRHFFAINFDGDTCTGVTPDGTTVAKPGPLKVNKARSLVGG